MPENPKRKIIPKILLIFCVILRTSVAQVKNGNQGVQPEKTARLIMDTLQKLIKQFVAQFAGQGTPDNRPTEPYKSKCDGVRCEECHRCKQNMNGEAKCAYIPGCCPKGVPMSNCLVAPCSTAKSDCIEATMCVDVYCNGCNRKLYNKWMNEIPEEKCTKEKTDGHGTSAITSAPCYDTNCEPQINKCAAVDCKECHECRENIYGDVRCVYLEGCCPEGSPIAWCLNVPCNTGKKDCKESKMCVNDYCNGCGRRFYDEFKNEIPAEKCTPLKETPDDYLSSTSDTPCVDAGCNPDLPTGKCSAVKCMECHECRENKNGDPRCVYKERCCPKEARATSCLVPPCSTGKQDCVESTMCVNVQCNGCYRKFYDEWMTEIPEQICTRINEKQNETNNDETDQMRSPCEAVNCGLGRKCEESPKTCIKAPCPQYECVRDIARISCDFDLPPSVAPPPGCNWQTGKNAMNCTVFEKLICAHEGKCPELAAESVGTCVESCSNDNDCATEEKCCSNGCGHVCKKSSVEAESSRKK